MIVYLHGQGEHLEGQRYLTRSSASLPGRVREFVELQKCVIVTPFAPKGVWWNTFDLMIFIKTIAIREKCDISRIYLCGVSMGGYAAWSMMSQYPNTFAAVVPVCGGVNPLRRAFVFPFRWSQFSDKNFKGNTQTAVWAFHGVLDFIVPYYESIRQIRILEQNGNKKCKLTLFNWGGHFIAKRTFDNAELYTWLLRQSLPQEYVMNSIFYMQ